MKIQPLKKSFIYPLTLLPFLVIGIFYALSIEFSLNLPWFDDIENIPYFLINWLEGSTFIEKWEALIRPNNEHRVVAARLIILLQYALSNTINFRILVFCGNLTFLGLFITITYNYLRQGGRWYFILPAALFIFNFQPYSVIFMTIMSMQYQMVLFLTALTFIFLSNNKKYSFICALFFAFLDTFSMGNGMMVWPAGVVILLFQTRWRDLIIWVMTGGLAIYFYFSGHDFVQGNDKGFTYIIEHPLRTFLNFFTMIGGAFDIIPNADFSKRMILPTLGGFVLFALFILWLIALVSNSPFWGKFLSPRISRYCERYLPISISDTRWNSFWLGTFVYIIITTLLVVIFRTRFDPNIILWATYKMYANSFAAMLFLVIIGLIPHKNKVTIFLLTSIITAGTWISGFINYVPVVAATQKQREAFAFNQKRNGIGLGATKGSPFETMVIATLDKAQKLNVYELPNPLIHPDENTIDLNKEPVVRLNEKITIRELEGNILEISAPSNLTDNEKRYAVMQSDSNLYLFHIPSHEAKAICPKGMIRNGNYAIGFWTVSTNSTVLYSTQNEILVK